MNKKYILALSFLSFSVLTFTGSTSAQTFSAKSSHELSADGPEGRSSYALIRSFFGEKALESPDLYSSNHTDVKHIIEDKDDVVGPHFVFLSHRDLDKDRDKSSTDRQRNEIKAYDRSSKRLKAFKGNTLQYRWKFKIDDGFEFSKSFTHFFQIKAKNVSKNNKSKDSDKYPVVTITAVDRGNGRNEFQFRHSDSLDAEGNRPKYKKLVAKDMADFTGQWIEFFVQATYEDEGLLIFQAKNIETGEMLVDLQKDNIDMWRGERKDDFLRPKWGIYRSLKDKDSLRPDEEKARFADFEVNKGKLK